MSYVDSILEPGELCNKFQRRGSGGRGLGFEVLAAIVAAQAARGLGRYGRSTVPGLGIANGKDGPICRHAPRALGPARR
jgi:hypothetical protein